MPYSKLLGTRDIHTEQRNCVAKSECFQWSGYKRAQQEKNGFTTIGGLPVYSADKKCGVTRSKHFQ